MAFGIFVPTMRRKRSGGSFPLISKIVTNGVRNIALGVDGSLWAWGSAGNLLGLGSSSNNPTKKPTQIGTDYDWVDCALGDYHCHGIKSNGTLWAWGGNNYQQLGIGSTTNQYTPVQVGSDNNWKSLPIRMNNYCGAAIKTDDSLYVWGWNQYGNLLGVGGVTSYVSSPTRVTSGSLTWREISFGVHHTLAVTLGGSIYTSGNNYYGQIGIAAGFGVSTSTNNTPNFIGATSASSKSIHTSGNTSFLRNFTSNQSQSFGYNGVGELGDGTATTINKYNKTNITNGLNYTKIAGSTNALIALDSSGNLYRWGQSYSSGILTGGQTTPVSTGESDSSIIDIASGLSHLMVLKNDGSLWSRGANNAGQLGNDSTVNSTTLSRIN